MPTITGTSGNDVLTGTDGADTIHGLEGNDTLNGEGGDDTLDGGDGHDNLYGNEGDDTIRGGGGNDYLSGGDSPTDGTDTLYGEAGDDQLVGHVGNDTLDGGEGNDLLHGGDGNDNLLGGIGDDYLDGGWGGDSLQGGTGNDIYVVDNASDSVAELAGEGTDEVRTGISYTLGANQENLFLTGPSATSGTGNGLDNLIRATVWGNSVSLAGLGGNDTLTASSGNDLLDGGEGSDTLEGGGGTDTLLGGNGNDTLNGGGGQGTLSGGAGNDLLFGASVGGIGNDILDGGDGIDTVTYAQASSFVSVNLSLTGSQSTFGGGTDTIAGIENLIGSAYNDQLRGDAAANILDGGGGNDQLIGGHGDDILLGEGGDDFVIDNDSGSGNDILDGGAGNDVVTLYRLNQNLKEAVTLRGGDGNDRITSWSYASGSVSIDAGAGDDYLQLFSSSNSHQITLGAGRDVLDLSPFQPHWPLTQTTRIVSDFQTGAVGDTILLHNLLSRYGAWDGQSNPFETGVIRLVQRGPDAVLQMSGVGGSPEFLDLLIFQGQSLGSFVAENFGGFSPNGVPAAPINLTGDGSINTLVGGYGDDIIDGLSGNDFLDGLAGDDLLRGGEGNDQIRGGHGDDIVEAGPGHDFIDFQHDGGSDSIDTGTGDDWVTVYRNFRDVEEHISIVTGDGNDTLSYQNFDHGSLTVEFGSGNDRFALLGARQNIALTLGTGADVVDFSGNYATLIGEMLITISDYVPGEDRLEWGDYLRSELIGWNGRFNPFAAGYLRLEQQPGQVVLFVDRDGSGTNYSATPFLILKNLALSSLSSVDFAGFVPGGANDVRNDFNGDGRSDILWRHDNGLLTEWLGIATGGFADNGANAFGNIPPAWNVAGTGDFNGDGRDDILWRHDSGQLTEWLGTQSGGFADNGANAFGSVPTAWDVAGIGDFNGDGRDDVLWRHSSGQLTNWLGSASGGFADNSANAFNSVPTAWDVAGVGDFNGDGRSDILWRHSSGLLTEWLGTASGGFADNGVNANSSVAVDWNVAGIGDFNGDGRDDILWRHDNGQWTDWLGTPSGGFAPNGANAFGSVPTDWNVASIGDFNGDGRDDILWRHDSGQLTEWLGTQSGGFADNFNNANASVAIDWQIQAFAVNMV